MELDEIQKMMERKNLVGLKLNMDSFSFTFYQEILDKYNKGELTSSDDDTLRIVLQALDYIYISGEMSPLSDSEYDALHSIYNERTGEFITNKVENTTEKKVKHIYPQLKGTLAKAHYIAEYDRPKQGGIKSHKSLEKFLKDTLAQLPKGKKYTIKFYFKFDGVSVVMALKKGKVVSAITRGDADTGEGKDVTRNFANVSVAWAPGVGVPDDMGMKTEVAMPRKEFEKFSKKYRSDTRKLDDPRSAASCVVNADVMPTGWFDYIRVVALCYYIDGEYVFPDDYLGDDIYESLDIDTDFDIEVVRGIIAKMKQRIDDYGIDCDGVVVRYVEKEPIKILGRDNDRGINKFEIAFKFPPEEKETTLENVTFQVGLLGKITPVAKITPVKMKGRTIKSIGLGSVDRLAGLQLRLGDTVKVKYEIIPYLEKPYVTKGNTNPIIEPITLCPYCLSKLERKPELMCVEPSCPSRVMGRIENFCSKMNIVGIGGGIIEALYNAGVLCSIEDLYRLKDKGAVITELDGFGPKSFDKIVKAVKKVKEVSPDVLLGSIGIPSIGRQIFKKILNIYYLDVLIGMSEKDIDKLTEIPGIKDATATKIIRGLKENESTIKFLLDRLKIVKIKTSEYNIVFTDVRNGEFEKHLEGLGYEIGKSVNKKTAYVITANAETVTGKTKDADKLGIPKLPITKAYVVFGF